MEPTAYPVDLNDLVDIWHVFMESGKISRWQESLLDPTVLQSWRRCMPRLNPYATPRLTPARGHTFESVLRAQADLITIGTPVIEDIHQFVEGSESAILLSDGSACILVAGGDKTAIDLVNALGLGLGAYWSEGQVGTTALGMVLINAMPAQVIGAEHYYKKFHSISSSAAPIHDVRGRIIGMISIIGTAEKASSHTLALVMSAARAISSQLQADWSLKEANHRLLEVNTIMSAITEGVIAWKTDGDINHVNAKAGEMLNLNPASVLGLPISQLLDLPKVIQTAVRDVVELHNVEVIFRLNGRAVRSLVSLRPIIDGSSHVMGFIALLRPIEQVRQLFQQQAGAHATITIDDVYGESSVMRRVLRQARIAARGLAPVLLRGEGGVGKNHVAQAIHNDSLRASKPFLAINCRAIPHELMASELLGEENDIRIRPSKFELAEGGTLLLDQVDSLSLEIQSALLQMIETGHVMRLGGTHPIVVDVRIIAATSEDLEQRVSEGGFLPHLYYRFGVFNITIPPLRQRTEDLPLLAERFLARITQRDSRATWIDDEAMAIFRRYPWPGNVRELESALERALHQSQDGSIRASHLPDTVRQGRVITPHSMQPQPLLSMTDAEREAIIRAGWACRGRVSEMARNLQIGRTTLWRKMKRHNITPDQFKQQK
jgi:transcriptional activator for dhaKLM operon